jgi:hypothetical protein
VLSADPLRAPSSHAAYSSPDVVQRRVRFRATHSSTSVTERAEYAPSPSRASTRAGSPNPVEA